jgi:hypothetical protein
MLSQNNYRRTKDKLLIKKKKKHKALSFSRHLKPSSCKIWDGTTRYGVIPSFSCSVSTLYQMVYILSDLIRVLELEKYTIKSCN